MKILFAGDVVHNGDGCIELGDSVRHLVESADYACCNIEGPIINSTIRKQYRAEKRGPSLYSDEGIEQTLVDYGFNVASLANNHIMDFGTVGLSNTVEILRKVGMENVGVGFRESDAYRYLELKGDVKVALLSVAEKQFWPCEDDRPGIAWMFHPEVYRKIVDAKNKCDFLILMCHCGCEGINVPLPQVRELYRKFIDFGVDVVIGNHPHRIQGEEEYKGKHIFYSLGNLWTQNGSRENIDSLAVLVEMKKNEKINILAYEIYERNGGIVVKDEKQLFDEASWFLKEKNEKEYISKIDDFCVAYYEDLKRFFGNIIGFDMDDKGKQEKFIDFRKKGIPVRFDDLFVWHNCLIETNRWIAERAILHSRNPVG